MLSPAGMWVGACGRVFFRSEAGVLGHAWALFFLHRACVDFILRLDCGCSLGRTGDVSLCYSSRYVFNMYAS